MCAPAALSYKIDDVEMDIAISAQASARLAHHYKVGRHVEVGERSLLADIITISRTLDGLSRSNTY